MVVLHLHSVSVYQAYISFLFFFFFFLLRLFLLIQTAQVHTPDNYGPEKISCFAGYFGDHFFEIYATLPSVSASRRVVAAVRPNEQILLALIPPGRNGSLHLYNTREWSLAGY